MRPRSCLPAVVCALVALAPAAATAQSSGTVVVTAHIVDSTGAAVVWYPCRTLTLTATAIDVVASARAGYATGGDCVATITGVSPLAPARLTVSMQPNVHCFPRTSPVDVYAPRLAPGGSAEASIVVRFPCDAATLSRALRAAGVSLEAPPTAGPVSRGIEERARIPASGAVPLARTTTLTPMRASTIEWNYGDTGGVCASEVAYNGLPNNYRVFYDAVSREAFAAEDGFAVGFDDGTWAGVLCGATKSDVWEGWAKFDLSSLASTGGYFGSATLVMPNAVRGFSSFDYTTLRRTCLGGVVASAEEYGSTHEQIDARGTTATLTQLPGRRAVAARRGSAPGTLSAGPGRGERARRRDGDRPRVAARYTESRLLIPRRPAAANIPARQRVLLSGAAAALARRHAGRAVGARAQTFHRNRSR